MKTRFSYYSGIQEGREESQKKENAASIEAFADAMETLYYPDCKSVIKAFLTDFINKNNFYYKNLERNMPSFFPVFTANVDSLPTLLLSVFNNIITAPPENLTREEKIDAAIKKISSEGFMSVITNKNNQEKLQKIITNLIQDDKIRLQKAKESIIDNFKGEGKGYITGNEAFTDADFWHAIEDYKHSTNHVKIFSDAEVTADEFKNAVRDLKASGDEKGTNDSILIPMNNGSHHFVIVKIQIHEGKTQVTLIDSMSNTKVVEKHRANNDAIAKSITTQIAALELTHPITIPDIKYTHVQQDSADCPYYAVREIAKECLLHTNKKELFPNDTLSQHANKERIANFKLEMIKKVARKKNLSVEDDKSIDQLAIDEFGIVHNLAATPIQKQKYSDYIKQRIQHAPPTHAQQTEQKSHAPTSSSTISSSPNTSSNQTSSRTPLTESDAAEIDVPTPASLNEKHKTQQDYSDLLYRLSDISERINEISIIAKKISSPYIHHQIFLDQLPLINLIFEENNIETLNSEHQRALIEYLTPNLTPLNEEQRTAHIKNLEKINVTHILDNKPEHAGELETTKTRLLAMQETIQEEYKNNKETLEKLNKLITERLNQIEKVQSKIQEVTDLVKQSENTQQKSIIEKANASIQKIQSTKLKKSPHEQPNEKATILYYLIMTQVSIDAQQPSRQFLNNLYKDESLSLFLETEAGKTLAGPIETIERELVSSEYEKLVEKYKNSTARIDRDNIHAQKIQIDNLSLAIQQEIAEYKDEPKVQAKVIEHWINVMALAMRDNNPLTALIIKDALSVDPKYAVISSPGKNPSELTVRNDWITHAAISPESKTIYLAIDSDIPQNNFENIKSLLEKSAPVTNKQALIKVAKLIEEISETEKTFYTNMKQLKKQLNSKTNAFITKNPIIKSRANEIIREMHYETKMPTLYGKFKKYRCTLENNNDPKESDLKNNIDNINLILEFFNSVDFTSSFNSCQAAINNFAWMEDFLNGITFAVTIDKQQMAILPVQRLPKYILLLSELIKSSNELQQSYAGRTLTKGEDEQLKRLDTIIATLNFTLYTIKTNVSKVSQSTDTIQSNKKIEYLLNKEKQLDSINKQAIAARLKYTKDPADVKEAKNPSDFYETYGILRQLAAENKYILLACHAEFERLLKEQKNLPKNTKDYDLINLNYSIAIHLLKHIDKINPKTQDAVVAFTEKLTRDNFKTDPQESLNFLNKITLKKPDKAKKHLKTQIADYQRKVSNEMIGHVQAQLANRTLQKKEEENKSDDVNITLLDYLKLIEKEWIMFNAAAALKPNDDLTHHSTQRIKLISEAIVAIEIFKKWQPDVVNEFHHFLIKELESLPEEKRNGLSPRTTEIVGVLRTLIPPASVTLYQKPNDKQNAFLPLYEEHVPHLKDKKADIIATFIDTPTDAAINAKTKQLLELIQDEWKIEEFRNKFTDTKRIDSRHSAIANALEIIKDQDSDNAAIDNALDDLLTKLGKIKPYYGNDSITDAISVIEHIKASSLYLFELKNAWPLQQEAMAKATAIEIKGTDTAAPTDEMIGYLTALQEEWQAVADAIKIKPSVDPDKHNALRMKYLADAIEALTTVKDLKPNHHQTEIICQLFSAKLLALVNTNTNTPQFLTERSTQTTDKLDHLAGTKHQIDPTHDFTQAIHRFVQSSKQNISDEKEKIISALEAECKDLENTHFSDFKNHFVDYLKCLQNDWNTQKLTIDDSSEDPESHTLQREALLDNALTNLNKEETNLDELIKIISRLHKKLNKIASPISRTGFISRLTPEQKKENDLRLETQESIKAIEHLFQISNPIIEALQTKQKQEESEAKRDLFHGPEVEEEVKADALSPTLEVKAPPAKTQGLGTAAIYDALAKTVLKIHPLYYKTSRYEHDEDKKLQADVKEVKRHHPLPEKWEFLKPGKIADLKKEQISPPQAEGKVDKQHSGLDNGHYNDYYNSNTQFIIREERNNDYLQISMPKKPESYDRMDDDNPSKYKIDIDNAIFIVTRWRDNCGNATDNPFLISDTVDDRTMQALIVVCKKSHLAFRAPKKASEYINTLDLPNNEYATAYGARDAIKPLNITDDEIKEIYDSIQRLKTDCAKRVANKPEHEKKHYSDIYNAEIKSLNDLVSSVQTGTLTVAALTEAIDNSKKNLEEFAEPPRRRPGPPC